MDLKFLKHKKSFKKGGLHTNPDIFWNIVQMVSLVLILASFAFGFLLFVNTNKEFTLNAEIRNEQSKESISKERLDKALNYFKDRSAKSEVILNTPSPVIDPSI